jgi:16S rRNA (uracil1498-N3)-methyltransferase
VTPPIFVLDDLGAAAPDVVVTLDGPEGRHAVSVMRLAPGEPVALVDGCGRRVSGAVVSAHGRDRVEVRVDSVLDEAVPVPTITVVQALAKGDRGERAVELLTEIGVDVIVPWAARNCVARWTHDRADRGHRRWVDAAHAAAKQARRARFPTVTPLATTAEVVSLVRTASLALLLHEVAEGSLGAVPLPPLGDVVLIVGPEGGIAPDEVTALEEAGAIPTRLGPTVLRTSSAGMAAVAVLLARTERWNGRIEP